MVLLDYNRVQQMALEYIEFARNPNKAEYIQMFQKIQRIFLG